MKIQRATFIGVRGVPDLTLDLTDGRTGAPRALVVVSGPSGSGKTRMIEALIAAKEAIRPYGAMTTGAPWIRAGQRGGCCRRPSAGSRRRSRGRSRRAVPSGWRR